MAKEVNLTSKEWIDLVFEGKNKEFGAYQMRRNTGLHHNKALLWTLIGILAIGGLVAATLGAIKLVEAIQEANAEVEQQGFELGIDEAEEEVQDIIQEKEEIKEVEKEDVQNSQKVTELQITNEKVEVKTNTEIEEDKRVTSNVEVDKGTDDINVSSAKEEVKVVDEPKKEEPKPEPKKTEEIFKSAEQMPQFPGGDAALMKYINSHIHYPAAAEENNIQGRVVVQFVVEKDGSVGQVKVARSVDRSLDNEAVRVVKSLPKFIPGKQNGQPVRVWYTLPVTFMLKNAG
ncbi:MAG: energy transducer TonB [Muribaculaceae bacterium]|nr:energy transducer TonB [Muribaculaceae bacterium]